MEISHPQTQLNFASPHPKKKVERKDKINKKEK